MKTGFLAALGIVAALTLFAPAVDAHHGDADRYPPEVSTITGTVVELLMTNPHAHLVLDVTEAGKTVRWQAELGGPQQLVRNFGWSPSTVKKGVKLTLTGRKLRSGAPYMNLTERANIVNADTGKEIYRTENYGQPPPAQ